MNSLSSERMRSQDNEKKKEKNSFSIQINQFVLDRFLECKTWTWRVQIVLLF